jgi:putative transposase
VRTAAPSSRQHRYPAELIAQCVRLSSRLPLSDRGVEELLFERGVVVCYETIRRWCHQFGPAFAAQLRRRRPQPNAQWPLDAVLIQLTGTTDSLGRAVDADGLGPAIVVQERRNHEAAERFLRRVVEGSPEQPRVAGTDTLTSDGPALNRGLPRTEHRKGLKNRAENSHQPTRQRERAMRRSKSPHQVQRFLEPFGPIREHFCPGRPTLSAHGSPSTLGARFVTWRAVTGVAGYRQRVGPAGGPVLGLHRALATR